MPGYRSEPGQKSESARLFAIIERAASIVFRQWRDPGRASRKE
jgi:hypothetical protein